MRTSVVLFTRDLRVADRLKELEARFLLRVALMAALQHPCCLSIPYGVRHDFDTERSPPSMRASSLAPSESIRPVRPSIRWPR